MKILLTHAYFLHEDQNEKAIMKPYPPLGILFLASWLQKNELIADVFDSTFSSMAELKKLLKSSFPPVIGIYSTLGTRKNVLELIRFIRTEITLKTSVVIIGGPDSRYNSDLYLDEGADYIIPGEGEETLTALIRAISPGGNGNTDQIRGLIMRKSGQKSFYSGSSDLPDLSVMPSPLYEAVDISHYIRVWKSAHGYSSMTISTMRGCPYSCNWCSKAVFGNTYRRRDPVSVVNEMIRIKNEWSPDQVWFTDDVFTISHSWLETFANEVARNHLIVPYECITRSDCLDPDRIGLLKESGCRKVWIGAESGSQAVIDLMNRKIDISWTKQMMDHARSAGILVGVFIMVGYPGEKRADIHLTAKFLRSVKPDDLTVGMAYPIKGTEFYEITKPHFTEPYDSRVQNEKEIKYKRKYSPEFYRFTFRYLANSLFSVREKSPLRKLLFIIKAYASAFYINYFN